MVPDSLPDEVCQTLNDISVDLIHMEQYLDFLRNRRFRRTLLCHQEQQPDRSIDAERVRPFHVATPLRPVKDAAHDVRVRSEHVDESPDGRTVTISDPIAKTALTRMGDRWPQSESVAELAEFARSVTGEESVERSEDLVADLALQCAVSGLLELSAEPSLFTVEPPDRPLTTDGIRLQAATGEWVTNLRHESVRVEDAMRRVLVKLDGTKF